MNIEEKGVGNGILDARDFAEVMKNGLPFLHGKARQYRLI